MLTAAFKDLAELSPGLAARGLLGQGEALLRCAAAEKPSSSVVHL